MDELELRIASIETALIEALGLIDPAALTDAARSLRERVAEASLEPDESAIRLGAAQLLGASLSPCRAVCRAERAPIFCSR